MVWTTLTSLLTSMEFSCKLQVFSYFSLSKAKAASIKEENRSNNNNFDIDILVSGIRIEEMEIPELAMHIYIPTLVTYIHTRKKILYCNPQNGSFHTFYDSS